MMHDAAKWVPVTSKEVYALELDRTVKRTAPGLFGSEPRPPLRLGLGTTVWSATQFHGLYSHHQPKRSAPRDQTRLVRTKHRKLLKKTKSVLNSQAHYRTQPPFDQ